MTNQRLLVAFFFFFFFQTNMKLIVAAIVLVLIVETTAQWYNFPKEAYQGQKLQNQRGLETSLIRCDLKMMKCNLKKCS